MSTDTQPCVLVIEDESNAREVICDSLEAAGCKAVGVADGARAIQALEKECSRPCVILLDLMMPGMNGWQFRDWQRQDGRFADVPVVVLSAVRDVRAEARKLGVADYIEKPVTFTALLGAVTKHCDCGDEHAA